jgi:hypothetical protein
MRATRGKFVTAIAYIELRLYQLLMNLLKQVCNMYGLDAVLKDIDLGVSCGCGPFGSPTRVHFPQRPLAVGPQSYARSLLSDEKSLPLHGRQHIFVGITQGFLFGSRKSMDFSSVQLVVTEVD